MSIRPVGHMEPIFSGPSTVGSRYGTTDEEAAAIRSANIRALRKAGATGIIAELYPDEFCPICGDDRAPIPRTRNGRRKTCGRESCRRALIARTHTGKPSGRRGPQSQETIEKKRRNWRNQYAAA